MEVSPHLISTSRYNKVMISGTARDLPEHRKEALEACLRQGMLPITMEHLPASDKNAIIESLRMVDEADIYIGIFAYRYGYIPSGYSISITEMEYNRAIERGIPRLIFIIDKAHSIQIDDIELGEGSAKLETLKVRLQTEQVVNFFKSPDDLRANIINSLSNYRQPGSPSSFHYVSDIPVLPEPYIAHRYTLLQTRDLVGRQAQLELLTNWVAHSKADIYSAHILNIISMGGMGKSALTWKWFNDIASHKMQPLAGRIWWSFYESDATFENFVICALAYVTQRPKEEFQQLLPSEREAQLLTILDHIPFLIVLDGLERILLAYARMDAAHMADEDPEQSRRIKTRSMQQPAFFLPRQSRGDTSRRPKTAEPEWLPKATEADPRRQRKTIDLRVGAFLRKLASVQSTRVLISSRLQPADLQTETGEERPGCKTIFLQGLSDDDALKLWRAFGINGSHEKMIPLFHTFDNHPLLIQVLAGVIAQDRRTPGDFDGWRRLHPTFKPFNLPLVQVESHILQFALGGLSDLQRKVLYIIAAFRMPATYNTLVALLVGEKKPFLNEGLLDVILADLENRSLLGWDRREGANRYDLHPLVRGTVWEALSKNVKKGIYKELNMYFKPLSEYEDNHKINSIADLTATIELYNTLIGLELYDEALTVFDARLSEVMLYRLDACRERAELLEMLFPNGVDQLPHLSTRTKQANVLNSLAVSVTNEPIRSSELLYRCNELHNAEGDQKSIRIGLCNLSNVLRFSGALYASEMAARRALLIARQLNDRHQESICLSWLGMSLAVQGKNYDSEEAFRRSLQLARLHIAYEPHDYMAMLSLWLEKYEEAQVWIQSALKYARRLKFERSIIRATRLLGTVSLALNDLSAAEKHLNDALMQARAINLVEEEIPALVGLADLQRRKGKIDIVREIQHDIQEPVKRGPFPLFHADAFNVIAQLERDVGNSEAAVQAALTSYRLSWCDGPPFIYYWGLQKSEEHLLSLGKPVPMLPPFDTSRSKSMPEIEITPRVNLLVEDEP